MQNFWLPSLSLALQLALGWTCSWIFEGGSPRTASGCQPPTVTFARPGRHTVKLTVCSDTGKCTSTSKSLIAQDPRPQIAAIRSEPNPAYSDETIKLSAEVRGRPPLELTWSFPDGATLTGNHVSIPPGRYKAPLLVSLRLTNSAGSTTRSFYPRLLQPEPRISSVTLNPSVVYPGKVLALSSTATGRPPLRFRWTLPDGSLREEPSVSWTVPKDLAPRNHLVALDVFNGSGSTSMRRTLRVLPLPLVEAFEPVCSSSCSFKMGQAVPFTITTSEKNPVFQVDWDGNGSFEASVTTTTPEHVFTAPGRLRPRLRITVGGRSEIRSVTRIITVTP